MGNRHSGVVRQVTVDLATALEDVKHRRQPRSVPLEIAEFTMLSGRLTVTARLMDPCGPQRVRARQARTELEIGRRDGVSGTALTALEAHAATRQRELETCLHRAGLSTVDIRRELPVFRSQDPPRTEPPILVRVLDPDGLRLATAAGLIIA